MSYSPTHPFIVPLESAHEYEPLSLPAVLRHRPVFGGLPRGVPYDPTQLCHSFLPDSLIDSIAQSTNSYAQDKMLIAEDVTPAEILKFCAIYYYMGMVRLPSKRDYWKRPGDIWPFHPVAAHLSRDRFLHIWANIHLVHRQDEDEEEEELDSDDDAEQEDGGGLDEQEEDEASANDRLMAQDDVNVWYEKAKPLLDHVNQQSKKHCLYPGFCISIDEQMKKFKGRSAQTERMKNKPIKEGFKFFALCDTTEGYVYHFVPNGRLEETRIADTVLELVRTLPDCENKRYVCGMDNYFTLPRTLARCRELGVGVVGTARSGRPLRLTRT